MNFFNSCGWRAPLWRALIVAAVIDVVPASADSVIHRYRLDENPIAAGTVAIDSAGALNGVYYGNVTSASGFGGVPNRAAHFDGSTGYLQLSNATGFNAGIGHLPNSTVIAWVKPDPGYATGDRFVYNESAADDGCCGFRPKFFLRFTNGHADYGIHRYRPIFGTWTFATAVTPALSTSRWYLMAGVLSATGGQAVYLFDDTRTLIASGTNGNTLPVDTLTNYVTIGAWTGDLARTLGYVNVFPGSIQDVTLYDYALTAAQIAALPLPAPPSLGPDLSITKAGAPNPVVVGSPLTYTITATNSGLTPAFGVTVTDPLPGGVTLVNASSSQGSCSGTGVVTCALGAIAPTSQAVVTIVVTPTAAGALNNNASVASSVPDPIPGNNSANAATTVIPAPTAQQQVANLIELVGSMNLGTAAQSFTGKLDGVQDKITRGQTMAACNSVAAFMNEVAAQSGKKLTAAQAAQLTAAANQIRAMLGC